MYAFILTRSSLRLLHIIFCTGVMALYLHKNFVSAQYLENHLVEFHQILYMHSSWQDLAWVPFFAHLHRIMALDLNRNFDFCSISRKQTDIFSPNFIYAFTLTREFIQILYVH